MPTIDSGFAPRVGVNYGNMIIRDDEGHIFIFWTDGDAGIEEIHVACSRDKFTSDTILAGAGGVLTTNASVTAEVVITKGRIHLFFFERTVGDVRHTILTNPAAWRLAGAWKQTDEVTQGLSTAMDTVGTNIAACADRLGNLYICGGSTTSNFAIAKRDYRTKTWSAAVIADTSTGVRSEQVCVTEDGFIHIFYVDNNDGSIGSDILYRRSLSPYDISSWTGSVIVLDNSNAGSGGSHGMCCAVSHRNEVMVVASTDLVAGDLRWNYTPKSGQFWFFGTGASSGSQTGMPRTVATQYLNNWLGVDQNGTYWIIYEDTTTLYQLKRFTGSNWETVRTIDVGSGDASVWQGIPKLVKPALQDLPSLMYSDLNGGAADTLIAEEFVGPRVFGNIGGRYARRRFSRMGGMTPIPKSN